MDCLTIIRWFMYSHRIVAYFLFTSLFFISSSLFAALTWLIFSLRSSNTSPVADDLRSATTWTPPTDENRKDNLGPESRADDDLTISSSVVSNPTLVHSSSGAVSRAYPPVTDSPAQEYRQSHKPGPSTESSASGLVRDEDIAPSVTQIKTDEELTGADGQEDSTENIERHPTMEVNF
jgi:hypothetical protein